MNQKDYAKRRANLLSEYFRLKELRLYRSAAARVREIAKLDFAYDGTPIDKTKYLFNHDSLIKL